MTFEQGQQCQALRIGPRMGRDKRPFLLGRGVQGLELLRAERGFEARIGRTFNGGHGVRVQAGGVRKRVSREASHPHCFSRRNSVYKMCPRTETFSDISGEMAFLVHRRKHVPWAILARFHRESLEQGGVSYDGHTSMTTPL